VLAVLQLHPDFVLRFAFVVVFHQSSKVLKHEFPTAFMRAPRIAEAESRKPKAGSKKKALRRSRQLREPNAGLVFLTMTCLGYLVFTELYEMGLHRGVFYALVTWTRRP
jgi:hypothetical protein